MSDKVSPTAFHILLLLSGGQKLTFHEIVKLTTLRPDENWKALQELTGRKSIESLKGKYMITEAGAEYLAKNGISVAEVQEEPSEQDYYSIPLFGTWEYMIQWLFPVLVLVFALIAVSAYLFLAFHDRMFIRIPVVISSCIVFIVLVWIYIKKSHHYVFENESLALFRHGKAYGEKGPGAVWIIPILDKPHKVDLREQTKEITQQSCITEDQLLVHIGLALTWEVTNPTVSLLKVPNAGDAIELFTTAVLRTVIADYPLNELMAKRKSVGSLVKYKVGKIVSEWGISLNSLEIKDIQPPKGVMDSIQNKKTANLDKEASLIKTDAQVEALQKLFVIGSRIDDKTLQLKYLETLNKIGEGPSAKYIIPMEFIHLLEYWVKAQNSRTGDSTHRNDGSTPSQLSSG